MFKALLFSLSSLLVVNSAIAAERPPQFVMLAFDNCQENQSWKQMSDFLDHMNSFQNGSVKFTFFLSAVGLLTDQARQSYVDPMGRVGKSNINFGGNDLSVVERIRWINKLHGEGNEIASHAVGHFQGGKWSVDQWRHEFDQYENIVNNTAKVNGFTGEKAKQAQLAFRANQLAGFRAPYLEGGAALNQVLLERGFAYDTSDTSQGWEPMTWPKQFKQLVNGRGLWNFGLTFLTAPLSNISEENRLKGLPRTVGNSKIPAMDYNFCFRQTGGCPNVDPYKTSQEDDAQEMLKGYLKQFADNYNGNRAPLNIGHHFEQYRGGSYNRAFLTFARVVCTLPEVKCTTYTELTKYMESQDSSKRAAYQAGSFPKGTQLTLEGLLKRTQNP